MNYLYVLGAKGGIPPTRYRRASVVSSPLPSMPTCEDGRTCTRSRPVVPSSPTMYVQYRHASLAPFVLSSPSLHVHGGSKRPVRRGTPGLRYLCALQRRLPRSWPRWMPICRGRVPLGAWAHPCRQPHLPGWSKAPWDRVRPWRGGSGRCGLDRASLLVSLARRAWVAGCKLWGVWLPVAYRTRNPWPLGPRNSLGLSGMTATAAALQSHLPYIGCLARYPTQLQTALLQRTAAIHLHRATNVPPCSWSGLSNQWGDGVCRTVRGNLGSTVMLPKPPVEIGNGIPR